MLGLDLTLAGMLFAGIAGIRSGGAGERPAMTAELADGDRMLKGTVTAGNLASDARVVVLAYGVAPASNGAAAVTELHRADIGPDGDGKFDYVLNAPVTGGSFQTVRIASWSTSDDDADTDRDGTPARAATTSCSSGRRRTPHRLRPTRRASASR